MTAPQSPSQDAATTRKRTSDRSRTPLFKLNGLSYSYANATMALRGINLEIHHQDRLALVGRNGSGKSTLVRHLNGLLPVQQGSLLYQGAPLSATEQALLHRRVGVLFQDPDNQLFSNSLYEDVAFGPLNQGQKPPRVEQLVHESLAAVGLEQLAYKPAHNLSYGQKKRAAFAAILAMEPEILILDEPTANLDPCQERIFRELLRSFSGTMIIIDHDLLFLYEICDRAVVLADGLIQHDLSMTELMASQKELHEHGLDFTFRFACCGHQSHAQQSAAHHHHHQHSHDHPGLEGHHPPPAHTGSPLLELQHCSFHYPDHSPGIIDLNLAIHPGEHIALVGENGAGKSTLASCLLGLHQAEGYLFFQGTQLDGGDCRKLWQEVGMVFQDAADQLFCSSCWDEVAFGLQQQQPLPGDIGPRVEQALAQVGLAGYEERIPLQMSGGERKRLALATALVLEPKLLILDEPTPGLDPASEQLLLTLLEELPMATLLISHDLFFIQRLCSRTVVLHQGQVVRDYSTAEFLEDEGLQALNGLDYQYKNACYQQIQTLQRDERSGASWQPER
ncbi:ABC transporter ATP-binding protein [Desulfogranum mediterraneum]|uniref:ABC transporter ATP-binding protein n=1 Tax=Desulfogranum mediterraneum TaxID=160661 RepID=UPI0004176607|nr:ABC transporter ATP-binding protein [Desulfogranum mediterraneum]